MKRTPREMREQLAKDRAALDAELALPDPLGLDAPSVGALFSRPPMSAAGASAAAPEPAGGA